MENKEELKRILKEKWSSDEHVPFSIERASDKSLLLLNDDFETYSFTNGSKYSPKYSPKYSYEHLFYDGNGDFKVLGWAPIDNLVNYPEKYFTVTTQITTK